MMLTLMKIALGNETGKDQKNVVCDIVSTRYVSKAVCGFTINHPDPNKKGMKLRYTVLEGPEIGVYCRGKVKNTNTIFLPDEWRHLVHEESITVSITPIGAYQDIFVKRIQDFAIFLDSRGGIPINAYYHIFAERKDQPKLITEFPAGQELSDQFERMTIKNFGVVSGPGDGASGIFGKMMKSLDGYPHWIFLPEQCSHFMQPLSNREHYCYI